MATTPTYTPPPPALPDPPQNTGGAPPYSSPSANNLPDPRRWFAPNTGGLVKDRSRPGMYTHVANVVTQGPYPLVKQPFHPLQKHGYNYPTGNGGWKPESEPVSFAQNQEWDYKTAPKGADGRPLGMNNEPLPQGAQGWTPFGQPDFGGGIGGWYKGALYDIFDNPEKNVIKDVNYLQLQKDFWGNLAQGKPLEAVQISLGFWQDTFQNLGNLASEKKYDATGKLLESRPTPLSYISRGIGEGIQGLGQGLDVFAQTAESGLGTVAGTLQDLGEGSPIPEDLFSADYDKLKEIGLQSEDGEWRLPNPFTKGETSWDLGWVQTLGSMTLGIPYNAMRALTAPPKDWDEVQDTLENNWQASRIAFSALNEESLKQEFIARYKNDEDPRLLAMELAQPWQELAGKLIADPLNFYGGGARKGAELLNHAEDAFKVAPELNAVMDTVHGADNLTEAMGVNKLDEMVTAAVTGTQRRIDDLAKNAEVFGRTATSKRHNLSQRIGLTLDNILGVSTRTNGALDTEKVLEQFDLMVRFTGGKKDEVMQALGEILGGGKAKAYDARGLLSTTAQETGLLMRRMLDDGAGNIDTAKFVAELAEAKKGGTAAMVELVNKKLTPALEELFPTTLERVSAIERLKEVTAGAKLAEGEDLGKLQRLAALGNTGHLTPFFARVHKSSRPVYNAVNGFLSGIYMGLSPGYAFRNALNNNFQMFVDLGTGAWKRWLPDDMLELGTRWGEEFKNNPGLGGISSAAASEEIRALSSPITSKGYLNGLMEAFKGDKDLNGLQRYGQSMIRVGEYFEQQTAKRLVGYAIDRAMTALTPKAINVKELVSAVGLSEGQAKTFQALVLRYNGDLEAAFKGMRSVENLSLKSVLNGLSAEDIQILKDHKLWDGLVASLEDVGSQDHLLNTLDDLFAEQVDLAKEIKSEHVIAGDGVNGQADEFLTDIQAAGTHLSNDAKALNSNKRQANVLAWDAYKHGARDIYESALENLKATGQPSDQLRALYGEYSPWITDTMGGEITKGSRAMQQQLIQDGIYGVLAGNKKVDISRLWGEFGLPGKPPSNLSRQEFKNAVMEFFYSEQGKRWSGFRDETMVQIETFLKRLGELDPTVNTQPAFMQQARQLYAEARKLDDAYMGTSNGQAVMKPLQELIAKDIADGKSSNAIRRLAQRYGIGEPGVKLSKYYDDYISAVIKKYGGVGRPMTLNDALKPVSELPERWSELMRGTAADMLDELKSATGPVQVSKFGEEEWEIGKLLLSDDPQFYKDLYQEGYKNRTTLANALQRIVDGKDAGVDKKYLRAMQEAVFNRLQEMGDAYPELKGTLSGKSPAIQNVTPSEAWQAFEARVKSKGEIPQIENFQDWLKTYTPPTPMGLNEIVAPAEKVGAPGLGARTPKIGDEVFLTLQGRTGKIVSQLSDAKNGQPRWRILYDDGVSDVRQGGAVSVIKTADPVETILNPPMGNQTASLPRTLHESLPGLSNYLDQLKTKITDNWGSYTHGSGLTPDQELKLSEYIATTGTARMQEARRMAGAVAQAQRKFTILDYGDKTNFDLALSMVMPYHFWYSRTYKNWMSRFMQDPKLLAHYARYRETLEQVHADSPEWWRQQINTNELLGIDNKNPWYWNLEATLNPLNGLTGTDFNVPEKRVDWMTRAMDDAARFGPSIWTPFTMLTAYSLYNNGEQEAASYWGGRMFPQTATLKAVASLLNIRLPGSSQYNELDPAVNFFSGGKGLDPFEQKRVGRAISTLAQGAFVNGEWVQISEEEALDAAYRQEGEIYDLAVQYALDQRAVPQLQSWLMGVGFKGRTETDIQIDQMYQDYYSVWNMEPNLSPDEFRFQMDQLHKDYPWMDSVLLAKKSGPERDRSLAYNVLGRIPPGQAGDISKLFGISPEMMAEFYKNKGNLSYMTATDRARFMAGVVDLSAALALPENATTQEWSIVRGQYKAMQTQGQQLFGENIWTRVGDFMALNKENPEAARLMIANNPTLQAALDWKEQAVMDNEMLFAYYGGMDFLRTYWEGEMFSAAKKEFGATIFEVSGMYGSLGDQEKLLFEQYNDMKRVGDPDAKAFYAAYLDKDSNAKDLYLAAHPELKNYWDMLGLWGDTIDAKLLDFEGKLREPLPHELRQDYNPQGSTELPAAAELGYQFDPLPTWSDYQAMLSPSQNNLVQDYFAGGDLSPSMVKSLTRVADGLDMPYEELLAQMEQAYYQEQVPVQP